MTDDFGVDLDSLLDDFEELEGTLALAKTQNLNHFAIMRNFQSSSSYFFDLNFVK